MVQGISISFPFKETTEGGVFKSTKTTDEALRADLIALLTLKRGQRPMQSKMFSPIYDYIFEPLDKLTQDELNTKIISKVKEFIPDIEIKKIVYNSVPEENLLGIKIVYTIKNFFDINQSIDLNFPITEQLF